jgi:hypothetical protein
VTRQRFPMVLLRPYRSRCRVRRRSARRFDAAAAPRSPGSAESWLSPSSRDCTNRFRASGPFPMSAVSGPDALPNACQAIPARFYAGRRIVSWPPSTEAARPAPPTNRHGHSAITVITTNTAASFASSACQAIPARFYAGRAIVRITARQRTTRRAARPAHRAHRGRRPSSASSQT